MRYRLFIFIPLLVLLAVSACKDNLHLWENQSLQGRWRLVKELHNGEETPAEDIKNGFIVFGDENTWYVEVDGKREGSGSFKIDPDKTPKTIDYTFSEGEEKGQTFIAIYELNGDSFKHCGVMNGDRPVNFSAEAGSTNYLVMFEREK